MAGTHFTGPLYTKTVTSGVYKQLTDLATITKLGLTVTDPPTQAEVQAIADKVDEIIQKLIDAGIIKES